jgi:hypothetical protein
MRAIDEAAAKLHEIAEKNIHGLGDSVIALEDRVGAFEEGQERLASDVEDKLNDLTNRLGIAEKLIADLKWESEKHTDLNITLMQANGRLHDKLDRAVKRIAEQELEVEQLKKKQCKVHTIDLNEDSEEETRKRVAAYKATLTLEELCDYEGNEVLANYLLAP